MKHIVPHDLDPASAKRALQAAIDAYGRRFAEFNPTATWKDDERAEISFNAKGVTLKGMLELTSRGIAMDLDVPFVFKFIQKKAIAVIEEEVKEWVAKAKAGEI